MNCDGNENNGKGDAPHVFPVICFQLEDTIQMSLQIITTREPVAMKCQDFLAKSFAK